MVPSFFEKRGDGASSTGTKGAVGSDALSRSPARSELAEEAELPPIVARMVVEIRSDGSKTVARGALEDLVTGERVSLQANATTPVALAKELSMMILKTPVLATAMAKQAVRDIIPSTLLKRLSRGKK